MALIIVGLIIGIFLGTVIGILWNKVNFSKKFVPKESIDDASKEMERLRDELANSYSDIQVKENYVPKGQYQVIDQFLKDANLELQELTKQINLKSNLEAKYEETLRRLNEQQEFINQANEKLKDSFKALSVDALKGNNESFVELAKAKLDEKVMEAKGEFEKKEQAIGELVNPLKESLTKMDTQIQGLENKRIEAYSKIWNYLDDVKLTTEGLKGGITSLVGALKTSHTRGRYGEIALKRLVEHAGMFEHCHFEEQVNVEDENGRLRPDMIIKLPDKKVLVVDSKAPLSAYMKMFETENSDEQKVFLGQHVIAMKDHLKKLSAKAYWSQFDNAPDFVIMYVHIESSYGIALQAWPEMIEEAMKNRIIVATPTVLLSILMGVGYSWKQVTTLENIEEIKKAAIEIYNRGKILTEHISTIGKSLNSTVKHYNEAVGSLEGKFLPHVRKVGNLMQVKEDEELPELSPIETSLRTVSNSNELIGKNLLSSE